MRRRKLLSLFLSLCLCLSLLPTAVLAEDVQTEPLTEVAVTFPAPKAGDKIIEKIWEAAASGLNFALAGRGLWKNGTLTELGPDDVYEAAQLDFCSPVKYFFTMVLPMSKTVVATVSVFTFLGVWNDYLWPSLVFTSSDLLTAQIGLNSITSNDNTTMGQTLAVITLITIPVIIIYALFSKQIVEGVTSTGSKEG